MEGGLSQFMYKYNKLLTATPFVPVNGTAVGLGNFLKGQRVDKKAIKKSYYEIEIEINLPCCYLRDWIKTHTKKYAGWEKLEEKYELCFKITHVFPYQDENKQINREHYDYNKVVAGFASHKNKNNEGKKLYNVLYDVTCWDDWLKKKN